MKAVCLVIVAIIATSTLHAQRAVVSSLTVGTGGSAMTILPPTGLTQPFTLDLSALASIGDGQTVQLSLQRIGEALHFVAAPPVPVMAKPNVHTPSTTVSPDQSSHDILFVDKNKDVASDAVRIPSTNGLIAHIERLALPKFNEYEQHTLRISVPGSLKGAVVMASPQSHMPSGFVVNYATCIEDGVVEMRIVNLTVDCIQPEPTTFSIVVFNATASRR
jgi:hypothetical protein